VKGLFWLLRGKHGIPDRGRSLTFEPQSIQGELIFVETAEQFYPGDRGRGRFEAAVKGDRMWRPPLMPEGLPEEGLRSGYIAYPVESEVDRLSSLVRGPISVAPVAAHHDIGLIDS
jgi:hypothetical protein